MCYSVGMSDLERLRFLTSQMSFEAAEDVGCADLSARQRSAVNVSHAVLPNGQHIALLKTLLSSVCENDCRYCPFRSSRNYRRARFRPEEFASLFMSIHQAGLVDGIFLSSGVIGKGVWSQDQLLATAEILRHKHHYRGYLHLKIMPGAEKAQVEQAMLLADRVSVNLEAPTASRLKALAPEKRFSAELLSPLRWIHEIRQEKAPYRAWKGTWPSSTTQFVVGGSGETDLELLSTTESLHKNAGLARAYYSSFHPVYDTPLEDLPPSPPEREHRLYQASFLLRDYGYSLEELPFVGPGNLPLEKDPKLAWAEKHLSEDPVEVNTASREELLRVPGFGPKGVETILANRNKNTLTDLSQLSSLGILTHRAKPFILLNGTSPPQQLRLF